MAANSKDAKFYHLKKAGVVWSYDYGWELNDEFIGDNIDEAFNKLMELKEKNK